MRSATTSEATAWLRDRLHPFGRDVGSIIPTGFAGYTRVLHPAVRYSAEQQEELVRWAHVANARGSTIQTELFRRDSTGNPSQFSHSGERLWDMQPERGSMPVATASTLGKTLRAHTNTPETCWFAVWEGWPDLSNLVLGSTRFSIPQRTFHLLSGPIGDIGFSFADSIGHRSPNIWWPEDLAWCVATGIDFAWTYVGGSSSAIRDVLSEADLEALPVAIEERW